MVRKGIIERREEKLKPRGKPFPKDNIKGKPRGKVLASSGCESSVEGGVVAPEPQQINGEPLKEETGPFHGLHELIMNTTDKILEETMKTPVVEEEVKPVAEESKDLELIESLDFINGPNKLSIRFSKKHNRMFRIQVFLNDEHEVRPVTYSGATTGTTFWNLLKGVLKK